MAIRLARLSEGVLSEIDRLNVVEEPCTVRPGSSSGRKRERLARAVANDGVIGERSGGADRRGQGRLQCGVLTRGQGHAYECRLTCGANVDVARERARGAEGIGFANGFVAQRHRLPALQQQRRRVQHVAQADLVRNAGRRRTCRRVDGGSEKRSAESGAEQRAGTSYE